MTTAQKTLSSNFVCLDLSLTEYRTYLLSLTLTLASVALPYILHQFHMAGQIFLPIYFFVLIGAYKFGWKTGALTAIMSPLASFTLTGMPILAILPFVLMKGVVLALIADFFAKKSGGLSVFTLSTIVLGYQLAGLFAIYLFTRNFALSATDLTLGYPGLLLEIIGGYILLKLISKYEGKELETNSR